MPMEPVSLFAFAGRLLIGGVFVFAGARNILAFPGLAGILRARGVPLPRLLLAAGIVLQLAAGGLVVAGLWMIWAAAALIAFLALATVIFHNFWDHSGLDRTNRINGMASNVALCGGFLLMIALAR